MSDVVVDGSVVAKWILPEADSAHAERLTTEVPAAGGRLIVLDLIVPEVGNAVWKSHRFFADRLAARLAMTITLRLVNWWRAT
jgi:predicted nucleic acid-binding protein